MWSQFHAAEPHILNATVQIYSSQSDRWPGIWEFLGQISDELNGTGFEIYVSKVQAQKRNWYTNHFGNN